MNVWSVHESECLDLLSNVLAVDADILTNYLGQKTLIPNEHCEPFLEKMNQKRPFKHRPRISSASQLSTNSLQSLDHQKNTYRHVLEHLVAITRWLQDKDVQPMLAHNDCAETLVHVDQILNCFGITNMEHLQTLVEVFISNDAVVPYEEVRNYIKLKNNV